MTKPNPKNRLIKRLALCVTPLVISEAGICLDASADPISPAVSSYDGGQILLADAGRRQTRRRSNGLLNRIFGNVGKENGADFIDPDFEDTIGPAGRVGSTSPSTIATQPAPKPVPVEGAIDVKRYDLPPLDLQALPDFSGAEVAGSNDGSAPPAVPPESDNFLDATVPVASPSGPSFQLTRQPGYSPIRLSYRDVFPADDGPLSRSKAEGADSLPAIDLGLDSSVAASRAQIDPYASEVWPADLYTEPTDTIDSVEDAGDQMLAEVVNEADSFGDPLEGAVLPTEFATSTGIDEQEAAIAVPKQDIWQAPKPVSAAADPAVGWRSARARVSAATPAPLAPIAETATGWSPSRETAAVPAATPTQVASLPPAAVDVAAAESEPIPPIDPTLEKLSRREGLTGLKGFCPVELCESRELIDADPRYAAVYEDRTYYVSSYDALLQFQENPAKYAPIAGGLDVVLAKDDDVSTDGILDHAAWYRGQLYLFATADTLAKFSSAPSTYARD